MKVLEGLLYTKEHEWLRVDGEKAYVGITDFAQKSLGDIVFIELPEVDEGFSKEDSFGVVESVKAAADLYMPISGKVIERNEELLDNPADVNEDPYGSWMIGIKISDKEELDGLFTPAQYEALCGKEE